MRCLLYGLALSILGLALGKNSSQPRWLSQYMPQLLSELDYRGAPGSLCTRQGALYRQHLSNQTLWAVTMHDASALYFDGLISGNTYHFGSFDACLGIHVPELSLSGKYCVVFLEFHPRLSDHYSNETTFKRPGPLESMWGLFKKSQDPRVKNKDTLKFALCIPSECTNQELQTSLDEQLTTALNSEELVASFTVKEASCVAATDETKLDVPAFVYIFVFAGLALTVTTVSLAHGYCFSSEGKQKFSQHWLASFSVLNTGKKFMKPEGPSDLHFLSGMKVLSMFLIIFGHRYLTTLYAPTVNVTELENKYGDILETILFNGPTIVNTFLLISGFLTYLKVLKDIDKGRTVNVILYVYYRWVRISFAYLAVILFSGLIMPHFITGPGWKLEGLMRNNVCRNNWWTHILYINNYYKADEECLLPGWYLAVDMQMFVLATSLGYLVSKCRVVEVPILVSLLILTAMVPAVITYVAGYGPIIRFYLNYLPQYWREPDYVEAYTKTHMRAAPYVMGMVTAKIYQKLKEKKVKIGPVVRTVFAFLSTILGWGVIFSALPFFRSEIRPSRLLSAFYSSFSKVVWSLAMSLFVLGQSHGGFGFLTKSFGNIFYSPLNKLTLCVLIIHPLVQVHMFTRMRQSIYVSASVIVWSTAGDIGLSYALAMVLYFTVEAPISSLNEHFLRKLFTKPK